jgi:hypothetical protein
LNKTFKTIGQVSTRSASNLNTPGQTADVYQVSADQLAAAGGGGHRTLYDVIQSVPGVTSTGFGRPRIRGSDVAMWRGSWTAFRSTTA